MMCYTTDNVQLNSRSKYGVFNISGNLEKAYSFVQMLVRAYRKQDACSFWLRLRQIETSSLDCSQLDSLIKRHSETLR